MTPWFFFVAFPSGLLQYPVNSEPLELWGLCPPSMLLIQNQLVVEYLVHESDRMVQN